MSGAAEHERNWLLHYGAARRRRLDSRRRVVFDGETAVLITSGLPAATFSVNCGELIEEAAARCYTTIWPAAHEIRITRSQLSPGQFYKNIARPMESQHWNSSSIRLPLHRPGGEDSTAHQTHLRTLINLLDRILLVVYPSQDTLKTYGYEIRNLLILACTECEARWRAILQANGFLKSGYTTMDYVRLERVMKLRDYEVSFSRYPSFEPVKPFGSWDTAGSPTQDLITLITLRGTIASEICTTPPLVTL